MLRSFEDTELVGEATSGSEALKLIERTKPDVAFLELRMPEIDGLAVARLLIQKNCPALIAFVTRHDKYAVRAFEMNAIDYQLRPGNRTRLRETLRRARARLAHRCSREDNARHLREAVENYQVHVGVAF